MPYITETEYSNIQKKLNDREDLLEALKKIGNMMHPNQSQLIINMRNVAKQAISKAEETT